MQATTFGQEFCTIICRAGCNHSESAHNIEPSVVITTEKHK
jgi:hypothetical protein